MWSIVPTSTIFSVMGNFGHFNLNLPGRRRKTYKAKPPYTIFLTYILTPRSLKIIGNARNVLVSWVSESTYVFNRRIKEYIQTKKLKLTAVIWWARRDLNPHEHRAHQILSLACIPISPLAHTSRSPYLWFKGSLYYTYIYGANGSLSYYYAEDYIQ